MQRRKRGYSEDGNVNEMLVKFILQNGKTEYRRYFILDDVWNAAEEKLAAILVSEAVLPDSFG